MVVDAGAALVFAVVVEDQLLFAHVHWLLPHTRGPDAAALLYERAEDLGDPGKDPVYGWGLLNVQSLCGGGDGALDPAVAVD